MSESQDEEMAAKIMSLPADAEYAHIEADKILCDLLVQLGYLKTVEAFNDLSKWYA